MRKGEGSEISLYTAGWWSSEGKDKNDPEFIRMFIEYLASIDDADDVILGGSGAYFGVECTVRKDRNHWGDVGFEVAYSDTQISVYTDNHQGFWVPEYIALGKDDEQFEPVIQAFKDMIKRLFYLG